MASQALYRRYRSQTFDELVGQEHIVQTLRNALSEGRVAHAYLFTGPRGVGKTSVARLLAKAVNCTAEPGQRPCGACESCEAIAEGRAVDVIEMDAASHTSVDDAREIIERVQFRPTSGQYKVYVIDEVHMLSTAAFNALLKTLEEPPGHAMFILATTESHKIPATILSRCQRFTFNRHTVASTAAHLHAVAAAEGFTLEPGVAETLARAATGSMRDALSVLDQLMAYGSTTIALDQVQNLLGAAESQEVAALVAGLINGDVTGALRAVAGVAAQGADLRQFARDVVERLRALMLLKAGGDVTLLDVGEDEAAALQAQASAADLGGLLQWVKLFGGLDLQIRTSAIPQLPLELAVVEALARPAAPAAVQATGDRRQGTGDRGRGTAVKEQPVAVRRPVAEAPVTDWDAVAARRAAPPEDLLPPPAPAVASAPAPAEPPPAQPEQVAPPAPRPIAAPAPPADDVVAQENAAVAALEQVEALWPDIVRDVRVHDKMVEAILKSGGGVRPIDVQGNVVVLEVLNDFLLNKLHQPHARQTIEQVLKKHTRIDYTIRGEVRAQHRENPNELREQIRTSRKDPHVKAAINIFDAEIVAVEADEE